MRCKEKVVYAYLYGEGRSDIIMVILAISPLGYSGRKILCSSRVFVCEKGVDNQKIDRNYFGEAVGGLPLTRPRSIESRMQGQHASTVIGVRLSADCSD